MALGRKAKRAARAAIGAKRGGRKARRAAKRAVTTVGTKVALGKRPTPGRGKAPLATAKRAVTKRTGRSTPTRAAARRPTGRFPRFE